MFGKEYSSHLSLLMQSFGEINENYEKKALKKTNSNSLIDRLKKIYILLFGIPEIGFQMRALYFKEILSSNLIDKNIKDILDVGCGIGAYTFWLGKKFPLANVIGGDIDKQKLQSCKKLRNELQRENITFSYIDMTKIKNIETYDLIIAIDVLEHIENYQQVLKTFHNLLRVNGYVYIHVPQPNQKRIFNVLKAWHHKDHIREGITKRILEDKLKKFGFEIVVSRETFGFFGKLAWETNHLMLSRSFALAGITFPFLYMLARFDQLWRNTDGLGVAILVQKNNYAK